MGKRNGLELMALLVLVGIAGMPARAQATWTDPDTGLMRTGTDNGSNVNWQQAADYCQSLTLGGYPGWRPPTIDELQSIYDPNLDSPNQVGTGFLHWHVKGDLKLTGWIWSSSQGKAAGEAWGFGFHGGYRYSRRVDDFGLDRALCVRHP
jgi:hypothetical protein